LILYAHPKNNPHARLLCAAQNSVRKVSSRIIMYEKKGSIAIQKAVEPFLFQTCDTSKFGTWKQFLRFVFIFKQKR
jgi:hypothetical protein